MITCHGVLKQINQGIPYNCHTQYMKKHSLPRFNMVYHCMPCNSIYFQKGPLCSSALNESFLFAESKRAVNVSI